MKIKRAEKKKLLCFLLLALFLPSLFAEEELDPILLSYERNFVSASLSGKIDLLRTVNIDEESRKFIGQYYDFALNFAQRHIEIMSNDNDMLDLTILAAQGATKANYKGSVEVLWKLFDSKASPPLLRVELLNALSVLGKGNANIVKNLNKFLETQNKACTSGAAIDEPLILAAVSAIGALGDASSYAVLFAAYIAPYSKTINQSINVTINKVAGDFKAFLVGVIKNNVVSEKIVAFSLGKESVRLNDSARAELAMEALSAGIGGRQSDPGYAELRYAAARVLKSLKWGQATDLAIRHFYKVRPDYESGTATKSQFLESIALMGAMRNSEAAKPLVLYLGELNSETEQTNKYDEEIVIAVANALGEIGDKIAFENLRYVEYMNYSEAVKAVARASLGKLKW